MWMSQLYSFIISLIANWAQWRPAYLGHMPEHSVGTPGSQEFSLYARRLIPHAQGRKEGFGFYFVGGGS